MFRTRNQVKLAILASLIVLLFQEIEAQSKCDVTCSNDWRCRIGKCILTDCFETDTCYQYCLNCAGKVQCYGLGPGCDYSANVVYLHSTSLKFSACLVFITLLTSFIFLNLNS